MVKRSWNMENQNIIKDWKHIKEIKICVRGGNNKAVVEVRTKWDGPCVGQIPIQRTNEWKEYRGNVQIPDGVQALYFTYRGNGSMSFASFTL